MDNPEIRVIDYGIAYTVFDGKDLYIEVNKHLKKYPELYKKVLDHELEHYKRGNTKLDFWIDFKQILDLKLMWDLHKFCRKHKSARKSNRCIWIEKGEVIVNWFTLIIYISIAISVMILTLWIISR